MSVRKRIIDSEVVGKACLADFLLLEIINGDLEKSYLIISITFNLGIYYSIHSERDR